MNIGNASVKASDPKTNGAARYLTIAQAAKTLGLSESTIRSWKGKRRIGFVQLGRAIRIPAEEITRLIEEGFTPARRTS
jgi:excisionase family DNA binding protein